MKAEYQHELRVKGAFLIQGVFFRYKHRLVFYNIWMNKRRNFGAMSFQRLYRGMLGRRRVKSRKIELAIWLANTPIVLKIQKCVRGHLTRLQGTKVYFNAYTTLSTVTNTVLTLHYSLANSILTPYQHRTNIN